MFKKTIVSAITLFALSVPLFASAASCPLITTRLALGSNNQQVIALKKFLVSDGVMVPTSYTTYFGPLTQAALQKWQCKKGIVCSGTPSTTGYGATGPTTRAALRNCNYVSTIPVVSSPSGTRPISTTLINPGNGGGSTAGGGSTTTVIPPTTYSWNTRAWSSCIDSMQTRTVSCISSANANVPDTLCTSSKPPVTQSCTVSTPPQCTPLTPETRIQSCPAGQTGTITQSRTSSCPDLVWSDWSTTSNSCITTVSQNSCTLDGLTIAHNSSQTFYSAQSVAYGSVCSAISQSRTCQNGTFSGSDAFKYANCAPQQPAQCLWNGSMINHGTIITANLTSTVSFGQQCQTESRACTNGTLSGSYTFASCAVGAPQACLLDGLTVNHNASQTFYSSQSVAYGQNCSSIAQARACSNGTLSGNTNYQYATCAVGVAESCSFNDTIVQNGATITAYQSSSVAYGQQCASQTRTCTNGTLSGTYTTASCSVAAEIKVQPGLANAIQIAGTVVPLYKGTTPIAVVYDSGTVRSYTENGALLKEQYVGAGNIFGGFDFDDDGVVDYGIAKTEVTGEMCGALPWKNTWIEIYSGKTGLSLTTVSRMKDACFPDLTNSVTEQWAANSVNFGTVPRTIAVAPQYATQGYFLNNTGGNVSSNTYIFPSTDAFDATYDNDQPNLYASQSYRKNSHVQNGLTLSYGGIDRFVMFTSGRVAQYKIGPLGSSQLIADKPFLNGDRTDIAGRNYGLVSIDPSNAEKVGLVSGSSAYFYWLDAKKGSPYADPAGGIERHVNIYDIASNSIDSRFFSYSHDAGDAYNYNRRIVYPAHVWLPATGGSYLIYNEFSDGHWYVHVSAQGSTADLFANNYTYRIPDQFVWDVRDLNGDGNVEAIMSPTKNGPASSLGSYLPEWKTNIYTWDAKSKLLLTKQEISGVIPYLYDYGFNEPGTYSSDGWLHTVLDGFQGESLGVYGITSSGVLEWKQLKI